MTKQEFMRQWAVDGMPADKQRLANAAWHAAIDAASDAASEANHNGDDSGIGAIECAVESIEKLK